MTRDETISILETAVAALRDAGFSVCADSERSYQWPDLHYSFSYDGEILGDIGITYASNCNDASGLFWECKTYCCVVPQKGVYRGLYQHINGTAADINLFVAILSGKSIAGERRKRKDFKKKEICEEVFELETH